MARVPNAAGSFEWLARAAARALLTSVLAGGTASATDPGGEPPKVSDTAPSPRAVLSAIESLESRSDAKCHSTASRVEDFLFGTPLSAAARHANVGLQKDLVRRVWSRASARAAGAGEREIGVATLREALSAVVVVERGDGELRVSFPTAQTVSLPEVRASQYASIAYSLRAILGVQQDFLISGGALLLELTPESVDALREGLDAVSVAVLELADQRARERSEFEVDEAGIREAWGQLVGEAASGPEVVEGPSVDPPAAEGARARALALLDEIAEAKAAAYHTYNEIGERDAAKLLVFNISRFYARRPLSPVRRERRAFVARLEEQLDAFSRELLGEAARRAAAAGQPLVRAKQADEALQRLVPHEIDEFEDVHVFGRLPEAERVTLESFDCDSFRDFGLHWGSLQRAAHAAEPGSALPDPYAAEILAEGISQYAVLLLRVAGSRPRGDLESARLLADDLEPARAALRDRAQRHHASPEPAPRYSPIVSARSRSGTDGGAYFADATQEAGVVFTHRSSKWLGEFRHKQLKTPPTFSGGGVAAEDVDGDSDVDLLLVGGGGDALLLNDGTGHFRNATAAAGLVWRRADGTPGEARSPIIADFDNDGRQDILITQANDDHRLYRNLGGARFEDVSAGSGLGGAGLVGGPATAFDFDGDGLLDVYVAYFGDYLSGGIPTFDRDNQNALPNRLYRNLGGMRFEDVTEGSGAADRGWTQAVSHVDFDRDGRQDLIVANDYGRNAFLRNLGGGKFENVAGKLGVTKAFHSMNVGVTDLNDDDFPDIYISNLATLVKDDKYTFPDVNTPLHFDLRSVARMMVKESDVLYLSQLEDGRLVAYAPSSDVERGATSTGWAWDAEFFDFDQDGDDDLYLVNGTNDFNTFSQVYRRFLDGGGHEEYLLDHRRESNVFFVNEGGKLRNRSEGSGADLTLNSRSTAYLDYDGDGDLDVAINNFQAPAVLLRNDAGKSGGWLALRLVGDPSRGSNRDAIGARITLVTPDGRRLRRWVQGGSGYLSMNPKQQHFGLGDARTADALIEWPNGERQALPGLAVNHRYTVVQGGALAGGTAGAEAARRLP